MRNRGSTRGAKFYHYCRVFYEKLIMDLALDGVPKGMGNFNIGHVYLSIENNIFHYVVFFGQLESNEL